MLSYYIIIFQTFCAKKTLPLPTPSYTKLKNEKQEQNPKYDGDEKQETKSFLGKQSFTESLKYMCKEGCGRGLVWDERDKINYQNGHCNKIHEKKLNVYFFCV